jgi:hypothetical protein
VLRHFSRSGGRHDRANPPYPGAKKGHTPPCAAKLLKMRLVACPSGS